MRHIQRERERREQITRSDRVKQGMCANHRQIIWVTVEQWQNSLRTGLVSLSGRTWKAQANNRSLSKS